MFANVPTLPGPVTDIESEIPESVVAANWHPCGIIVEVGWNFDGSTFTPPAPAPAAAPSAEQVLQQQATLALVKSDVTIVRCVSAGVVVPSDWQTYRNALRAIANGTDTTSLELPATPAYPAGT